MITVFAAEAADRVRGGVVHLRVGAASGGAGLVWPGGPAAHGTHLKVHDTAAHPIRRLRGEDGDHPARRGRSTDRHISP